jgi:mannosyltransferase OCH1-like enzyme
MIPKVIHYCWFGRNPLPPFAVKCIESWKKFLPGYEIKEWNEDNFDVNIIPYTQEAYEARKYAFVSDYARFYILYHHGGIYFDTDVEVIKSIDDIIERGAFMGCENEAKPGATALAVGPWPGLQSGPWPVCGNPRPVCRTSFLAFQWRAESQDSGRIYNGIALGKGAEECE